MVSGQALAGRASASAAGSSRPPRCSPPRTADSDLDGLIDDFVDELAFHLVNLAILVNPARIAVGGGIVRSWAPDRARLQHALRSGTPFPPELVVAHFPYDAPLLGAVAMAVDAARAPRRRPRQRGRRASRHRGARHRHDTMPHDAMPHDAIPQDTINTGTLS